MKRYSFGTEVGVPDDYASAEEDRDGEWVRYDDAMAELDQLRAERDRLRTKIARAYEHGWLDGREDMLPGRFAPAAAFEAGKRYAAEQAGEGEA